MLKRPMAAAQESLSDRAYFAIREWILRGELKLGAPLSRQQLARTLEMSVQPVSEALQRLETEGFVETRYRAGTRVRIPTAEDIRDHYVIREALETQAARLVAERATLRQRQELRRMAEQVDILFARVAGNQNDAEFLFIVHNQHFQLHMRLAECTGCNGLRDAIEKKQVLVFNWLYMVASPGRRLPPNFHGDLVRAINTGDPETADKAMRVHIRHGLEELLATLLPQEIVKWRLA